MNNMARLQELNKKVEREGLTEAEKVEVSIIHSMALRDGLAQSKQVLEQLLHNLER